MVAFFAFGLRRTGPIPCKMGSDSVPKMESDPIFGTESDPISPISRLRLAISFLRCRLSLHTDLAGFAERTPFGGSFVRLG
jgi:hypothetical protein